MPQKESLTSFRSLLFKEFELDIDAEEAFAISRDLEEIFELLIKHDQTYETH